MYLQNKAVQQSEEVPRGMEVCSLVEDDTEDSYQEVLTAVAAKPWRLSGQK